MMAVNESLKSKGIVTWFDSEQIDGDMVMQTTDGIDKSACVLVAISQRYMTKVDGKDDNDSCKIEFQYAQRKKNISKMVPIPIETRCLNPQEWSGSVGALLGGQLYHANLAFDIEDSHRFEAEIDKIVQRIANICSKL